MVSKRVLRSAALLAVATTAAGCAHVGQDDFDAEMERVRAEMLAGDQGVEERLSGRLTAVESSVESLEARMDRIESDLQELADEFGATVQRLETALRFAAPVHFAFDDATVQADDREVLARFASVVNEHYPGATVTVEGFTDPAGSAAYNMRLGQRRADAVKAVLVDEGSLDATSVRAVSYGEDTRRLVDAGAMGPGESGKANRRVVLVIDHADGPASRAIVTQAGQSGSDR